MNDKASNYGELVERLRKSLIPASVMGGELYEFSNADIEQAAEAIEVLEAKNAELNDLVTSVPQFVRRAETAEAMIEQARRDGAEDMRERAAVYLDGCLLRVVGNEIDNGKLDLTRAEAQSDIAKWLEDKIVHIRNLPLVSDD